MTVMNQSRPEPTAIPGVAHATWAGQDQGLTQLSLWRQVLAPGAATPPHRHTCDEVVLCLAGQGQVQVGDTQHRFGADQTVVLPGGVAHQIVNIGGGDLHLLGIFGQTPVATELADGTALPLPWRT